MCTVTYILSGKGCFITSSRDESIHRPASILPTVYNHNGTAIVYPKDAKANGSWIACTETGNAAVLLNGAFVKHTSNPPYRKSRGIVFLDIISNPQPEYCFMGMNLYNIEPFTLILFVNGFLSEARWDGEKKYFVQLNEKENYIWSSATLYTADSISKRKQWFDQWLADTAYPNADDVFNFHQFAGDGDSTNSILMNRNDQMMTVSITGIHLCMDTATMQHVDLKDKKHTVQSLPLQTISI